MARKKKTATTKDPKVRQFDLEALGLVLLALGLLVLGLLLPAFPSGNFGLSARNLLTGTIGVAAFALPWPLLIIGSLFLLRRNPPAWPRVLGGYLLLCSGAWTFLAVLNPAAAGRWGETLNFVLAGAAGMLGGAAALLLATLGVELIVNWPPTTIVRTGMIRLIEFLRLTFRAGLSARNRAKAHAGFHADVVQERNKLRDLDQNLQLLAGLYPGSSEVDKWRQALAGAQSELRNVQPDAFEDIRMDIVAWQEAVQAFTRERGRDLGASLAAEGLPGFGDWWRDVRNELEESVSEPIAPARELDDLRQSLLLGATAVNERYQALTRERDLAEPALRDVKPRELVRISEQHDARLLDYRKIKDNAAELHRLINLFHPWRQHMNDVRQLLDEQTDEPEVKDYSETLAAEIREHGRDALGKLEGWAGALVEVAERARQSEGERAEQHRLAEEKAVDARIRQLAGERIPAAQPAGETAMTLHRYPRETTAGVPLDASSPSRRLAAERRAAEQAARKEGTTTVVPETGSWNQRAANTTSAGEDAASSEEDWATASMDSSTVESDDAKDDSLAWIQLDEHQTEAEPEAPEPSAEESGPLPPTQAQQSAEQPDSGHASLSGSSTTSGPASGNAAGAGEDSSVLQGVPPAKSLDDADDAPAVGGIPIQLPPYTLLDPPKPDAGDPLVLEREVQERVDRIDETLANFRLEGRVVASVRGPTVTRFEVEPAPGEKISRFANLSDDLALAMAVGSVRIEAPIPGKSVIGLEVPNAHRDLVKFRVAAEAPSYKRTKARLPLILGKSIDGELVVGDLVRMPHLLIAGSTGSGKSVAVNTLVGSLLYKFLPTELRFLMIDPKMVELTPYDGIPHMLRPVVTNASDAADVLLGAVKHMERRYKMMSKIGAKNLDQYNEKARNLDMPQLPFIIIIIDELADLMITSPKEVESAIMRLAQMARATGMHLVLATQRPSVDILTSLIKVNVPARMAFAVSSGHDSRTILDAMGAERLVGLGDMLYYQPGLVKPARLQGPFISETEIANLAGFLRRQYFDDEFVEAYGEDFDPPTLASHAEGFIDWNDEKLRPAAELVIQEGQASVSRLQRRLQVGHARAGKLMDSLENLGVVGPHSGSKPRDVLVEWGELPNIFGK